MRILLVDGTIRKSGYTQQLVRLVSGGVTDAGGELDLVDLASVSVNECLGCYHCWSSQSDGQCVISDDMPELLMRFSQADVIVLATPLYFYSFSSRLKRFLERLLPITQPKPAIGASLGLTHNALRNPATGSKTWALLVVGAHRSPGNMDGIVKTFEILVDGLDGTNGGILLRPESYFIDFPASKPVQMRKILAAFENAGRELAKNGAISKMTQSEARAPLTATNEAFGEHFETYWKISWELGIDGTNRSLIEKAASEDLRILMPELSRCFDPVAAGKLEASFEFALSDTSERWRLSIKSGRCNIDSTNTEPATVTIHTSSKTLVDIILQRIEPRKAYANKQLSVEGDRALFARFGRLFKPPA